MPVRKRIRLLIADDERLFREALRVLLETEPGFRVVGYASDGAEAVSLARKLKPDVLLLDLAMPRVPGMEALRALTNGAKPVRTIVVTAAITRAEVVTALQQGARGIVLKDVSSELLFKSIRAVVAGQYWVGHESVSDLITALRQSQPAPETQRTARFDLTPREIEIVQAVVKGYSNKEIASQLGVAEDTIKHHLTSIFDKVGVSSRLELALFAVHHNLLG